MKQSWRTGMALGGRGELHLPEGQFTLRGPGDSRLHFTGPGVLLVRGELLTPLSAMRGRYHHPGSRSGAAGARALQGVWQIAVPPLVAGPEGTKIDFILTNEGPVCLLVREGRACVDWMDQPSSRETCLEAGEGVALQKLDVETRTLRPLGKKAAEDYLQQLEASNEGSSPRSTPLEKAYQQFYRHLPGWTATEVVSQAELLFQDFPDSSLSPRALYFGWLWASAVGSASESGRLRALLIEKYSTSTWSSIIEAQTDHSETLEAPVPQPFRGADPPLQ